KQPGGGHPQCVHAACELGAEHGDPGLFTRDTDAPDAKEVVAEFFCSIGNDKYMNDLVARLNIEPSVTSVSWKKVLCSRATPRGPTPDGHSDILRRPDGRGMECHRGVDPSSEIWGPQTSSRHAPGGRRDPLHA